jgi:PAS domain S-box-containing protein
MPEGLRILHLEDDQFDAELVQARLNGGGLNCQIVWVKTGASYAEALQRDTYDVILADMAVPGYSGLDALALAHERRPETPFIFVTGAVGDEQAVETMRRGATDFVLKERLERLRPAVERAVREARERHERQRAEAALRESEVRFRVLADSAPMMVWMAGTDGMRDFVNQTWLQFTGRHPTQEMGLGWAEGLHPNDYTRCTMEFRKAFEARQPFELEYRLRRADGQYRWIIDRAVPRFEADDTFAGYIGSCIDITERKQAQAQVQSERERLRVTLSSIGDAVIATDIGGRVTFMNPVAAGLVGQTAQQAAGRPVHEVFNIISEHNRASMDDPVSRVLQGGHVVGLANNTLLVSADGREIPIDDSGAPIRDENGDLVGAVLVFRDIRERRAAERALQARVRQQAAVAELGQLALSGAGLDELLEAAVERVAQTLEVELCKVLELLPSGDALLLRAGVGWQPGLVGAATVGAGVDSQAGYTLLSDQPVVVDDLRTEERFSGPPLLAQLGVISSMSVIIRANERPYGVLGAHSTRRRPFTHDDTYFLRAVANVLGAAAERQRAEEALRVSRDQIAAILQGIAEGVTVQSPDGRLIFANDAAAHIIGSPSAEALAATPPLEIKRHFECFDESGEPLPVQRLPGQRALLGEQEPSALVLFKVRRTGEMRWSHLKARPIYDRDGQVQMAVNIFTDVTGLKRAERTQRILAETGRLLTASLDYQELLTSLAHVLVPDLADWCLVDMASDDGRLELAGLAHATAGYDSLVRELRRLYPPEPGTQHPILVAMQTGRPQVATAISDQALAERVRDPQHLALLRALGTGSHVVVPLIARGRTLGAISLVCGHSGRRYDESDLQLAEEVARRAALAIDNARLYTEAQKLNSLLEARVHERTQALEAALSDLQAANSELEHEVAERRKAEEALRASRESLRLLSARMESAREDERSRMAREIHDELGGSLTGLKMDLSRLQKGAGQLSAEAVVEKTRSMSSMIDGMVQTVRRIAMDLRPGVLDDLGLAAAIEWQLDEFEKRTGIACRLRLKAEDVNLEAPTATGIFRTFQEALTNVARHAGATRVAVSLETQADYLVLRISDNGRGIAPAEAEGITSFGLMGMRERARLMSGELEIVGTAGEGTTVQLKVPYQVK